MSEVEELFEIFQRWAEIWKKEDSPVLGGQIILFPDRSGMLIDWAGQRIADFSNFEDGIAKIRALITLGDSLRAVPTRRDL